VLFDVDILFRQFAGERGMKLYRAESLNDSPLFVRAVADLVRSRLSRADVQGAAQPQHSMKKTL
jgi:ferrochelatase